MSTKFVRASNKKIMHTTGMYDSDSPLPLFQGIAKLNALNGHTMKDWKFKLFDYKGEYISEYDWKNQMVTVSLGELFR